MTRAQARLEALRQAGVDVNKWLQKAESIQGDRDRASSSTNELTPNLCAFSVGLRVVAIGRCSVKELREVNRVM